MNVIRKIRRANATTSEKAVLMQIVTYLAPGENRRKESNFVRKASTHPPQNLNRRCQSCWRNPPECDFNKRSLKKLLQLLQENWIPRLLHRAPFLCLFGGRLNLKFDFLLRQVIKSHLSISFVRC